tara:strand:+ start:734 stop:1957 length:1224 start_codon:yes stop_codon:yes gene_type:complete
MANKWDSYYKSTLNNIHNNIDIFKDMIIYYCKIVINNKLDDTKYIKDNYNLNSSFSIFKKYILKTKNLGIFTIFNNIPDVTHPLEDDLYLNYGCYLSFIDPSKFNINPKLNIIIKDNNIFKYQNYKYPFLYQDVSPYNINKKYIFINIKYFNFKKYSSYALLLITNNNLIYSFNKNILKQKKNNKWVIVDGKINNFIKSIIYVSVLRSIDKNDITNTFNSFYTIKENTKIYSHNKSINNKPAWFTLDSTENLADPYHVWYKKGDIITRTEGLTINKIKCLNLCVDILSNNKIIKTNDITDLLFNSPKNIIYNGNLNFIFNKPANNNIFNFNKGKRLLNEIYLKTSNFTLYNTYYFDFLFNYNFHYFINSIGYYDKIDKFYKYELGFYNNKYDNLIKIINTKNIKITY